MCMDPVRIPVCLDSQEQLFDLFSGEPYSLQHAIGLDFGAWSQNGRIQYGRSRNQQMARMHLRASSIPIKLSFEWCHEAEVVGHVPFLNHEPTIAIQASKNGVNRRKGGSGIEMPIHQIDELLEHYRLVWLWARL